jgi:hypothetical protein
LLSELPGVKLKIETAILLLLYLFLIWELFQFNSDKVFDIASFLEPLVIDLVDFGVIFLKCSDVLLLILRPVLLALLHHHFNYEKYLILIGDKCSQ